MVTKLICGWMVETSKRRKLYCIFIDFMKTFDVIEKIDPLMQYVYNAVKSIVRVHIFKRVFYVMLEWDKVNILIFFFTFENKELETNEN